MGEGLLGQKAGAESRRAARGHLTASLLLQDSSLRNGKARCWALVSPSAPPTDEWLKSSPHASASWSAGRPGGLKAQQ